MQTTPDLVAAARAELLARLLYKDTADEDARGMLDHLERVAQLVGSHGQRAILWLRHILNHEQVEPNVLVAFGFDSRLVDGADTLGLRARESLRDYAKRVAGYQNSDVISLAVATLDDRISQGISDQHGTLAAYKGAGRILRRAADALAKRQAADPPPAGGAAGSRSTAPVLRGALMALIEHSEGAQHALVQMMTGPRSAPWEIRERLSLADLEVLVTNIHDLLQVVGVLLIDVTAQETEDTSEDKRALFDAAKKGVTLPQAMETIAQTVARRLQDFNQRHRSEEPEEGQVH